MAGPDDAGPRVFISYAHENEAFRESVKQLAEWLTARGIVVITDRIHEYRPPELGWIAWMQHEIEAADVALCVCSPKFKARFEKREQPGAGKGITFEGAIMTQDLYDASMSNDKFFPILPDNGDYEDIPVILRPFHNNHRFPSGNDGILRLILNDHPAPSPTPLPAGAHLFPPNLPWPPNPFFTGRREILGRLEKSLGACRPAALTQAVAGEGGVGKTAIALEYCHRHLARYNLIWWVQAEGPTALRAGFAALAPKLKLSDKNLEDDETVQKVTNWLATHLSGLLVFDNVSDPEQLASYLPTVCSGHVIITSRRKDWAGIAERVEIEVMAPDEAVDFLLARAEVKHPADKDRAEAAELARALGYLPLALEQAGAFAALVPGFKHYLERFNQESARLFTHSNALNYEETVWTTYNVSLQAVEEKTLAGIELMKLMAFFAPDNIPLDVIKNGAEFLPPKLADDVKDVAHFDQDLKVLNDYSLIKLTADFASVHRLLQAVIRERMSKSEQKTWAKAAVKAINKDFPGKPSDVRNWPKCDLLFDHALAAAGQAEEIEVELEATARLLNQVGLYLLAKANYSQSEGLMRRALKIAEASFGPDHPEVAICLNNLARLLKDTNRLSEAEPLMRRVIDIFEKSLGENHPKVATAINNLAGLLQDTNRLSEAEPLMRRALQIDEASFGPDHPEVATDLNNLAQLLQATNRLSEAEPLMRRALQIDEASFGPDHPDVAIRLNNLARLLQATNRLSESEPLMRRAYEIFLRSFGEDHPHTVLVLNNLRALEAELKKK